MRLGILGAGAVGAKHDAAAGSAGIDLACVVDRAAVIADAFEAASSDAPPALWDDDSIDAVIIGVPNYFHRPLAIEAMRVGKDVLVEKPMALTTAECDERCEAAAALGLPVAHQMTQLAVAFAEAVSSRCHGTAAILAEGRKVQVIVDAIYKSSSSNSPVTL